MSDLEKLKEAFELHAQNDERNFKEIKAALKNIDSKLDPVADAYRAIIFSKSFVTGLAAIIVAITAIGAGFIYLVNSVVKH